MITELENYHFVPLNNGLIKFKTKERKMNRNRYGPNH